MQVYGNHGWNCCNTLLAVFLTTFVFLCTTCQADSGTCIVQKGHDGHCFNAKSFIVEHGYNTLLCCSMKWSYITSPMRRKYAAKLEILIDNKSVDPSQLTVCGKNSIALPIKRVDALKFTFTCRLRLDNTVYEHYEVLRQYQVAIGLKPEKPRNFKCESYNLAKLVCTWEPVANYIPTQFALQFKSHGSSLVADELKFTCPASNTSLTPEQSSCTWDASAAPPHTLNDEYYTLTLNARNVFGNKSFVYKYHHWANVIPSEPDILTVLNTTSSSALLRWTVPSAFREFPPGLHYRVLYRNLHNGDDDWHSVNSTNMINASEVYYNLTDLESPNAAYNVRVSIKSPLADSEEMWGPFREVIFKTAKKPSSSPPDAITVNFEIHENSGDRDVHIYWPSIPPESRGKQNLRYRVIGVEENGRRLNLQPDEVTEIDARFKKISSGDWKFKIAAVDASGRIIHEFTAHVPPNTRASPKPVNHTRISSGAGKLRSPVISRIESDQVRFAWQLNYPGQMDNVTGYNVYYCAIHSSHNCEDPRMNTIVRHDQHVSTSVVGGLEPNTTYILTVTVLSEAGEGFRSDPLYFTTLEAEKKPFLSSTAPTNTYTEYCDRDIDSKLNVLGNLESTIVDFTTQLSNLSLIVSALKNEYGSWSKENCQLRENLTDCRNKVPNYFLQNN